VSTTTKPKKAPATWVKCPGYDEADHGYSHSMRDGCWSCAPYWETFPVCPVHDRKLPHSGWCKTCRKYYGMER